MFSNFSKHHQDERGEGGREGIPASSNVTLEGHRARVSLACLNWKYQKRFDSTGKAVRNLNEGTVLGLKQSWEGPHLPFPVQNAVLPYMFVVVSRQWTQYTNMNKNCLGLTKFHVWGYKKKGILCDSAFSCDCQRSHTSSNSKVGLIFLFYVFFVPFYNFWRIIQKCAGKSISKVN